LRQLGFILALARPCGDFVSAVKSLETNKQHDGSSICEAPCSRQASQNFSDRPTLNGRIF
jgi:hypothetical protein